MNLSALTSRTLATLRRVPAEAWLALPLLIAFVNVVLLVAKLRGVLGVLYLNSDIASSPVISSLIGSAPAGRIVTVGNYPWYEVLWFMRATHGLPAHRQIWEAAPLVLTVASYVVVVRLAWVAFDRWTALMTAAILMCVAPFQQFVFFTPDMRVALLAHACLLLAVLAWLSRRSVCPPWVLLAVLGLPVAAFTAAAVASDQLAFVGVLAPFLGTACLSWWRFGGETLRRVAIFAIVTVVAATVGGALLASAMRADHIVTSPHPLTFVVSTQIFANLEIFANGFALLGGGRFFGLPLEGTNFIVFGAGALTLLALALVLRWLWIRLGTLTARASGETARGVTQSVYLTFWGLTLIGVCASFLVTSAPQDETSARYLGNAYVAVAALVPLLAGTGAVVRRALVAAGIGVFAALTIYGTTQQPVNGTVEEFPIAPVAKPIEEFVLSHGAKYGYARYWDAAGLSWDRRLRIQAYPVFNCAPPKVCPFFLHTISTWYAVRPNTATFLIEDAKQPYPLAPDPAAGKPAASRKFGTVTVHVYDHDIAASF